MQRAPQTPDYLVQSAVQKVRRFTDVGDQMQRRAAQGKVLVVHLSKDWIELRLAGNFIPVAKRSRFYDKAQEAEFIARVQEILHVFGPPIPGEIYVKTAKLK